MNGFDDDLNYINAQFTSTLLNIVYAEQETHDPWYQPLEISSILRMLHIYNSFYKKVKTFKDFHFI